MKNRLLPGILVFILVITSLLISCTNTTTPSTSSTSTTSTTTQTVSPTTTTATQSNWWDTFGTPKYGGTINIQASSQGSVFDPWVATPNSMLYQNETLVTPDWTVDRKVWAMDSPFVPLKYYMGLLAKSWEKTDATTLVFHLREGVHWQNKPPVNGREFVADDVVQHYNRILGTGSGYTQPSSVSGTISLLASVTATDKYTVTFKFKNSSLLGMFQLFDSGNENAIENPEAAKVTKAVAAAPGPPGPPAPGGDSQASTEGLGDWHNAAGT
jgi:ABC-type transport system substrate-binding protein